MLFIISIALSVSSSLPFRSHARKLLLSTHRNLGENEGGAQCFLPFRLGIAAVGSIPPLPPLSGRSLNELVGLGPGAEFPVLGAGAGTPPRIPSDELGLLPTLFEKPDDEVDLPIWPLALRPWDAVLLPPAARVVPENFVLAGCPARSVRVMRFPKPPDPETVVTFLLALFHERSRLLLLLLLLKTGIELGEVGATLLSREEEEELEEEDEVGDRLEDFCLRDAVTAWEGGGIIAESLFMLEILLLRLLGWRIAEVELVKVELGIPV